MRRADRLAVDFIPRIRLDEGRPGVVVGDPFEGVRITVAVRSRVRRNGFGRRGVARRLLSAHDVAAPDEVVETFVEDEVGVGRIGQIDGVYFACGELQGRQRMFHGAVLRVADGNLQPRRIVARRQHDVEMFRRSLVQRHAAAVVGAVEHGEVDAFGHREAPAGGEIVGESGHDFFVGRRDLHRSDFGRSRQRHVQHGESVVENQLVAVFFGVRTVHRVRLQRLGGRRPELRVGEFHIGVDRGVIPTAGLRSGQCGVVGAGVRCRDVDIAAVVLIGRNRIGLAVDRYLRLIPYPLADAHRPADAVFRLGQVETHFAVHHLDVLVFVAVRSVGTVGVVDFFFTVAAPQTATADQQYCRFAERV